MSRSCQVMLFVLLSLGALPMLADEPGKSPAPVEMVARFHDGTTIRKAALQESIPITTRYGKLMVPVGDIRRIEFGLHISSETAQKIEEAVRNLGHAKFPLRDAASKELVAHGFRAYGALQTAVKSKDKEVATRAAAALDSIRATVPEELLRLKPHDVIHTRDCVLAGQIESPILKAKTANFGELQFKIADLHSLQSLARSEAQVAVEAGEPGALKWYDTGLAVENGMDLVIRASGQIDFANQGGPGAGPGPGAAGGPGMAGPLVSGPDGCPNVPRTGAYLAGTLLGKIGDRGDVFPIGQRFEGRASQEGRLHLLVMPWQGAANPTGSYKVNIATGFDLVPGARWIEPGSPGSFSAGSFGPGTSSPFGGKKKTKAGFGREP